MNGAGSGSGAGGVKGAGLCAGSASACGRGGVSIFAALGWFEETVTEETVTEETVTEDVVEDDVSCCGGLGGADARLNPVPGWGLRPVPAVDCLRLV